MLISEVLDRQFDRICRLLEEGYISDLQYECLHSELCVVARTTEPATQNSLAGEQGDDDEVVAPPDGGVSVSERDE